MSKRSARVATPHPAVEFVLQEPKSVPFSDRDRDSMGVEQTTSLSLARALAVGCLSRIDPSLTSVDVWDPAAGSGFAGFLLADALQSSGVEVRYRGQDISEAAVSVSRRRFEASRDAEISVGDTLSHDAFADFRADLVIVDAPWGMDWRSSAAAVEARHQRGEFSFGLPQQSDSTWLFISLALEKLHGAENGGGRVAALVNPGALSSGGRTSGVRRRILEAGLLESVTRLPDGLALTTAIPLYLLTFSNKASDVGRDKAMIADLQTAFTTVQRRRAVPVDAFRELEFGLRTGKPGPRNRMVSTRQFTRRDAHLSRVTKDGRHLSWAVTTYKDTPVDDAFLIARYGPASDVALEEEPRVTVDLDPAPIFVDDSRELLKDMASKGWACRRLSSFLAREPERVADSPEEALEAQLFVPTTHEGNAAVDPAGTESRGRVISVQLEDAAVQPTFLAAWLNSEQGVASRQRAIAAASSGHHAKALRSDARSLMHWADELLVPVPELNTQIQLASADERLRSFRAELDSHRASVWTEPESADAVVAKIAGAFDGSLRAWLDQLPFPIASALWTAETTESPGEQQLAYLHAWEAIVTFHATVLLSVCRRDPGSNSDVEVAIRQTLQDHGLSIEKASLGTWIVIVEKTSKELRRTLESGDADEAARVRRAFAGLGLPGIERLISNDIVQKFKEVNTKRNRWHGHSGHTSEQERVAQVESLVSDLRDLRDYLGNAWTQILLVRARSADRGREWYTQTAEVAVGTRSPFATEKFKVGDPMISGELYLVRDGSESPLPLGHFVQLRSAPPDAQYTSYFYNRTEGPNVRMVTYQYGSASEVGDDVDRFRDEFGSLVDG